jgi:hypothetical protein
MSSVSHDAWCHRHSQSLSSPFDLTQRSSANNRSCIGLQEQLWPNKGWDMVNKHAIFSKVILSRNESQLFIPSSHHSYKFSHISYGLPLISQFFEHSWLTLHKNFFYLNPCLSICSWENPTKTFSKQILVLLTADGSVICTKHYWKIGIT